MRRRTKFKCAAKEDLSIEACTIYPATYIGDKAYTLGPIHGRDEAFQPWVKTPSADVTEDWARKASDPKSHLMFVLYGPVHKKSTSPRPILYDFEQKRAWYIKRNKRARGNYREWFLTKEMPINKFRKELLAKAVTIFNEWFKEQFD